jgi:hypothetical protein
VACVYQHRRLDDNSVFYIGVGKDISRAYSKKKRNKYWKHIVEKVGYGVDVLIDGCTIDEAKSVEVGMISDYGRADLKLGLLVNMTDGGDGTINHSPEVIKSISAKLTGRKISLESSRKSAMSRTGLKRSQETRNKISNKLKGIKKSDSHKLSISKSKFGVKGNNAKVVYQFTKNGVFINSYQSQKEASLLLNIVKTSINNNLKGVSNSAGGFIFKYQKYD